MRPTTRQFQKLHVVPDVPHDIFFFRGEREDAAGSRFELTRAPGSRCIMEIGPGSIDCRPMGQPNTRLKAEGALVVDRAKIRCSAYKVSSLRTLLRSSSKTKENRGGGGDTRHACSRLPTNLEVIVSKINVDEVEDDLISFRDRCCDPGHRPPSRPRGPRLRSPAYGTPT